jgi:hypothetical protein
MWQYLRWLWNDAPRSLRMEVLLTLMAIELLGLATILVLKNPN